MRKYILFLGIFLLVGSISVYAINTIQTGFQIANNSPKKIEAHNNCKIVTNTSNIGDAFIPTGSKAEWDDIISKNKSINHLTFQECINDNISNCSSGQHLEGGTCKPNIKQVSCKQSGKPSDSSYDIKNVNITWNTTNNTWNTAPDCSWTCDSGYMKNGNKCVKSITTISGTGCAACPNGSRHYLRKLSPIPGAPDLDSWEVCIGNGTSNDHEFPSIPICEFYDGDLYITDEVTWTLNN